MKVAELMDDLETGDRSMEHLKKPNDGGLTADQRSLFEALQQAGNLIGGGFGQLGQAAQPFSGLQQQNMGMNQYANMQGGFASNSSGPWR